MAAPHPDKWERVLNQTLCLINTGETAENAFVSCKQNTKVRKCLFFAANQSPYRSKFWNKYGNQLTVTTNSPIEAIRLIRFGSMTHSTDTDQRSVGLSFTPGPQNHVYPYNVSAPADADIAPPGLYMFFVLKAKSQSLSGQTAIPSIAKIVKISS